MKNLFIILLFSMQMFALPGDLDTSFGVSGGYVVSDFFSQQFDEEPNDVAVQSDGKIVLGGTRSTSTLNNNYDFLVVRYNSDMSLDTTFSGDGIFTLSDASFDVVNAIAIQADGKIVAVGEGTSTNEAYVFRLNANGTLDTTFSGDGIVNVSSSGFALSVAIQTADSKIVIGTKQSLGQTAILRLTTTGILDTTFDGDGRVFLSPNHYFPLDIAIQTDGKIVAVGTNSISNSGVMSTVRLLSNGSIDTTFDGDGYANTAPFSGEYYAKGVLIQADGKIVVGGGVAILALYPLML